MKQKKLVIISAALAGALALAGPAALAQSAGGGQQARHGGRVLKCLSILGLTDQQKADIKAVFDAEKPVLEQLGETLKTDRQALKAAVQAGTDACAIGNALLKVKADGEAIRTELEHLKTNVEALLTPDQKSKFEGCLQAPHNPASQAVVGEEIEGLD